jgi:hypothetical protein
VKNMGEILRSPSGNALLLIPRSGSHSIAAAALESFWPAAFVKYQTDKNGHPAVFFPEYEARVIQDDLAIILRNPVERFRSTCAHRPNISVADHLANPIYETIPQHPWKKIFLFESQLQECADWLGITVPLPQIDATEKANKPTLTPEQEARVREIYAADIALWESLQP